VLPNGGENVGVMIWDQILLHHDDNVSALMALIDTAVGFNDLFQRVAAVDDGLELEVGDRFAAAGCLS